MSTQRFSMPIFSGIILRRNNEVCLLQRGAVKLHAGFYAIAGGGIDGNETIKQGTVREAQEELGINLEEKDLSLVHVLHVKTEAGGEYINFFMEATIWQGKPSIMEPHKFDNIAWFMLDNLPKNIMPMHRHVFEMIGKSTVYSEYGWQF